MRRSLILFLLACVAGAGLIHFLVTQLERNALAQLEGTLVATSRGVADMARDPLLRGRRQELQKIAVAAQRATGSRVRILDGDKLVVADSLGVPSDQQLSLRNRPEIDRAGQGNYSGYTRFDDDQRGSLSLYLAYPVVEQGNPVGIAYVSHPTDGVLQKLGDLRRDLRNALAISTFLIFLAALYLSGQLQQSLRRLSEIARRVPGSEAGGDAVTEIGQGLDRLVNSLQEKVALLEGEKLKTRQFLEDVAHELKTPITGLTGSVEALISGPEEERRLRLLRNVERETRRLNSLVSSLLQLQNLDYYQLQPQSFELLSLLETAVDNYSHEAEKKSIRLELIDEGLEGVLAWGDPAKLLPVLENLLDNAIRCSPPEKLVEVSAQVDRDRVVISVRDQGPGFDSTMLQRYRSQGESRQVAGLGLGLAIAEKVAEKHGDRLHIDSSAEGTTIRFALARSRQE